MVEYNHEFDQVLTIQAQLRLSRVKNKGKKEFKKHLRNMALNYIKKLEIRTLVFERDNYKCVQCGSNQHLQIDHIKSVYSGGENKICNLQTLCRSCNAGKRP